MCYEQALNNLLPVSAAAVNTRSVHCMQMQRVLLKISRDAYKSAPSE